MTGDRQRVRAGSYCRLSLAKMGDSTKVDDQDQLNHEVGARLDWSIHPSHVFKDNSRSAWRRDRKRPGWDDMLAAIEAGELDAIIVYHGDRLIRQPHDLELLLNIADKKGILLASPTGTRNLDDPDDRFILRIEAAQACREVDNTSRRMKRGHQRRREQGMVRSGGRGGRAYGFHPDNLTPIPAEVGIIRECARRLLAGDGLGSMAQDLNERGERTVTGAGFSRKGLKRILERPRYAGLMPDGVSRAAWAPVLDDDPERAREMWVALVAVLNRRAALGPTLTPRRHLLTGIAVCGTCEQTVVPRHHAKKRGLLVGYACVNPKCGRRAHRAMKYVDEKVIGTVLAVLADEDLAARMAKPVDPTLMVDLATLEANRDNDLAEMVGLPEATRKHVMRVTIPEYERRIADLAEKIGAQRAATELGSAIGMSRAEWDALPLARRRALVRATVHVVLRPGFRGPGFNEESVDVVPSPRVQR